MVFQGTVLGPTLWNVFFADSRPAVEASGADELKYADDMTATNEFELNVVIVDHAKEEVAVLHPVFDQGDAFRFLGAWIDPEMTMDVAMRELLSNAKPKLTSFLRLPSYYSRKEMFAQFKTSV